MPSLITSSTSRCHQAYPSENPPLSHRPVSAVSSSQRPRLSTPPPSPCSSLALASSIFPPGWWQSHHGYRSKSEQSFSAPYPLFSRGPYLSCQNLYLCSYNVVFLLIYFKYSLKSELRPIHFYIFAPSNHKCL